MSGRGEWWEVMVSPLTKRSLVSWTEVCVAPIPDWVCTMGINDAVAKMAHEGEEDAVLAILECHEDGALQAAVAEWGRK